MTGPRSLGNDAPATAPAVDTARDSGPSGSPGDSGSSGKGGGLVYLMGPSGAGKDSLLGYARARIGGTLPVVLAHRYITRSLDPAREVHVPLTAEEFGLRQRRGLFAMSWASHGYLYGIGCEVDAWMAAGLTVLVNGSREYLSMAQARYPALLPVLVQVNGDALRHRLEARGRESPPEIADRLARSTAFACEHPDVRLIDNSSTLTVAGEAFIALIGDVVSPCRANGPRRP